MSISDSHTEFRITSKEERYCWVGFLSFVLLSSLVGDTIILIGSTKHNALRLNKFIVAVLQHIAACDLVACVGYVLPTMISLLADRWILGDVVGHIHLYLDYYSCHTIISLTCGLVCSKLLLLKCPLWTKAWTKKKAHVFCASIWLFANIYPILRFIFDTDGPVFSYISYNVNFGLSSNSSKTPRNIAYSFTVLTKDIPTLSVMIAICLTLKHLINSRKQTRRIGGKLRWQGIATVVATATVFCVSIIPHRISYYMAITVTHRYSGEARANRALELLTQLNIMSNFYIYCLTVPSFRTFIRTKVLQVCRRLGECLIFSMSENEA